MIEILSTTLACGFIDIICIRERLFLKAPTDQQRLCRVVDNSADWCRSKAPPTYPTITRDQT
jgi:hypothetical protein